MRGALAAAVTPLREDGAALDEEAFGPYLDFLAAAGLNGVLALGTTGEGILLSADERRAAAELYLGGPLPVIVHCGAQTTAETVALARHAAERGAAGVAVISPPYYALDDEALLAHLGNGGDLLIAYAADPIPSVSERALFEGLGLGVSLTPGGALPPWQWRSQAKQGWTLQLAPRWRKAIAAAHGGAAIPTLRLRTPRWLPDLQREDALLLGADGAVVAAAWNERRGRVVVLPAEVLANARLYDPAHAALLETLRGWLDAPWRFDEYHHGLGTTPAREAPAAAGRGLDLLLLQLLLVYLMAALALSRRLGPAWRETPPLVGSAGGFLLRLGALHHRLGHHGDGAALLLRRASELDRRLTPDSSLRAMAERGDAAALVEVGQSVARLQRR